MKLAVISDIHIDENKNHDVVGTLASVVRDRQATLLLLAGDISADADRTLSAVARLEEESGARVLFVPGNHDLWSEDFEANSTDALYERFCRDPHCLSNRTCEFGRTVILGDTGWYDYSFGSPRYTDAEFSRMSRNGRTWNDRNKTQWTEDNKSRHVWFLNRLQARMEAYKDKQQVIVTHMVPIRECTVAETRADWDYFNAFLGSEALGQLYKDYPVVLSVFGHVHYRRTLVKDGITWACRCLNYDREWRREEGLDLQSQIEDAIDFFDVN